MAEARSGCRPRLTVVTGRPGAGKTTLAHALARAIRCPAVCRDEIKEGFINSLTAAGGAGGAEGAGTDEHQRHANDVFFKTVELLLREGVTLVAEAAFQHRMWAPQLEPLVALAAMRIIECSVDPALARSRHVERGLADPARERFHGDDAVRAAREGRDVPLASYDPPRLDVPTLVVDTTDRYRPAFESVVGFARGEGVADAAVG
jgi:predicted kinase